MDDSASPGFALELWDGEDFTDWSLIGYLEPRDDGTYDVLLHASPRSTDGARHRGAGLVGLDDECSSITIPRDEDAGMRLAHVRLVDDPVLFMTERALLFFDGDLRLVWRSDEEFVGWSFEKVADGQVHLIWSDWSGREARPVRSLRHGRRTG